MKLGSLAFMFSAVVLSLSGVDGFVVVVPATRTFHSAALTPAVDRVTPSVMLFGSKKVASKVVKKTVKKPAKKVVKKVVKKAVKKVVKKTVAKKASSASAARAQKMIAAQKKAAAAKAAREKAARIKKAADAKRNPVRLRLFNPLPSSTVPIASHSGFLLCLLTESVPCPCPASNLSRSQSSARRSAPLEPRPRSSTDSATRRRAGAPSPSPASKHRLRVSSPRCPDSRVDRGQSFQEPEGRLGRDGDSTEVHLT